MTASPQTPSNIQQFTDSIRLNNGRKAQKSGACHSRRPFVIRGTVKISAADVRFRLCTNFAPRAETRADFRARFGDRRQYCKTHRTYKICHRFPPVPSAEGRRHSARGFVGTSKSHTPNRRCILTLRQYPVCRPRTAGTACPRRPSVSVQKQSEAKRSKAKQGETGARSKYKN